MISYAVGSTIHNKYNNKQKHSFCKTTKQTQKENKWFGEEKKNKTKRKKKGNTCKKKKKQNKTKKKRQNKKKKKKKKCL